VIARIWRGATRASDAETYADYLHETGIREYRATPGNLEAFLLRRVEGDRAEFITLTLWDSLDAIERFAGEDVERAVYYPEERHYLIDKEDRATHWEVLERGEG
jgi:heme-degrading monooxygenase HmoA